MLINERKFLIFVVLLLSQLLYHDAFSDFLAFNQMKTEEFCEKYKFEVCDPKNGTGVQGSTMPAADEEEYDRICEFFSWTPYHAPCMTNYFRTCSPNSTDYIEFVTRKYSSFEYYCDRESPVYKVLRSKSKCIRKGYIEGKCDEILINTRNKAKAFSESGEFKIFANESSISYKELKKILWSLITHNVIGCELKHAEKCHKDIVKYIAEGWKAMGEYDYKLGMIYIDEYLQIAKSLLGILDFDPNAQKIIEYSIEVQRSMKYEPIPGHFEAWFNRTFTV